VVDTQDPHVAAVIRLCTRAASAMNAQD